MGYLCQKLSDGKPLDRELFLYGLHMLLPDAKDGAAEAWADFARECVSMKQYVNSMAEPDEAAVCRWHDTILAGFVLLTKRFGWDTATKVCDLGLDNCCLYPYEMERTAEELRDGVRLDDLVQLMNDGKLEADEAVFPTLRKVLDDMDPSPSPQLNMTF